MKVSLQGGPPTVPYDHPIVLWNFFVQYSVTFPYICMIFFTEAIASTNSMSMNHLKPDDPGYKGVKMGLKDFTPDGVIVTKAAYDSCSCGREGRGRSLHNRLPELGCYFLFWRPDSFFLSLSPKMIISEFCVEERGSRRVASCNTELC